MKKNVLLLRITLAIFAFTANAQQSNTSYGIQAGTNYARYTPRFPNPNTEDIRYAGKIGLYVGGFVNFKISEQIRIQPSLLFASQGSKLKNENVEVRQNSNDPATEFDFEFNIIESTIVLPVVAQNYLSEKFYIEAGPQVGYIFSLKDKSVGDTLPGAQNDGTGNLSNNDKLDLGLLVGFGYKLSENFGLNSRYYFGVIERNNGLKSSVFNLGIEYSL
ncbi:porin family protein [Maribacter luteus]|uniref:Outer membrane beta-barrel protein n=1 Tax=Maribacter luteus TaxID=2594478 RepID=A0A6I2MM11_9FLAO|nr:porin family protein [Maribacter luteus]MRX64768.1 outer membrane beta-barrel protein [Maribacter luteus]